MPPKKILEEDYIDDDGEEELDQDESERPPIPEPERVKPLRSRVVRRQPTREIPSRQQPREVQKRYVAFSQEAAQGIMDNETRELIAPDILTALAEIINRLDRMEDAIGVMQG